MHTDAYSHTYTSMSTVERDVIGRFKKGESPFAREDPQKTKILLASNLVWKRNAAWPALLQIPDCV